MYTSVKKKPMVKVHNKLAADPIGIALESWNNHLEQVCPLGITTSFVMDQTARAGP
jgi:hypothetical protein